MKADQFEFRDITSTEEVKIGDIMVYVKPEGWLKPDIGSLWAMNSEDDLMAMSIRLVESSQIWRPLVNPGIYDSVRHKIDYCKPTKMKTTPLIELAELTKDFILPFMKEKAEGDEEIIVQIDKLESLVDTLLTKEE